MKTRRVCITGFFILLMLLGTMKTETQSEYKIYLPVLRSPQVVDTMADWKIIVPVATTNYIENPSFETGTTGWVNTSLVTFTESTNFSKYGSYSLRLETNALGDNALFTVADADGGETWTASCWVYVVFGDFKLEIQENSGGWSSAGTVTTSTLAEWVKLEVTVTLTGGVTDARVLLRADSTASSRFYVDGVQFEEQSEATTFCDGDQDGCEWNGTAHGSTSTRSALSRAGGYIRDLGSDYSFDISQYIGSGMSPVSQILDDYAILPGGQVQGHKTQSRSFSLVGMVRGSSSTDLHDKRQTLISLFEPSGIPNDQPFILRYTGATVDKEISAYYESGLSLSLQARNCYNERFALRFLAADPYWYELGESSDALDTNDSATFYQQAARLRSTGQWDELGLSAAPTAGFLSDFVLRASDGTVYYVGNWTGHNGVVGRDYVARYDPFTDTWSTIDSASAFGAPVSVVAEGPDGIIYFGGSFIAAGGDVNADYICQYDPTTDTISALATGGTGSVLSMTFGLDGVLYFGGTFVNWNGSGTDNINSWNGSAYASVGGGINNTVLVLRTAPNGNIYAGGSFTAAGGVAIAYISFFDGTAWNAVADDSLNGSVGGLDIDSSGIVYAGGTFTNASSEANADRVALTKGQVWEPMSTGANNTVQWIESGPDDTIYAVGSFTQIGDLDPVEYAAKWNGFEWGRLDINFPGSPVLYCLDVGPPDPVITANYDIWTAYAAAAGTTYYAGNATVTNDGTAPAAPVFTVARTGGTSAKLISIRNETTGKELLFEYDLLDGETLTINLESTQQSVISDFFGSRPDAIASGSDTGSFTLIPGDNNITAFVDIAGGPTITTFCVYRDTYTSLD